MNKELTIKTYNGVNVTDSREVAEMVGKNHAHLCRDIQGYIKVISQNPKLDSDKFFVESSYKSGTGKEYTCYLLTKQGCEMVANKMTGEKGILFTAEYVQAFNKMEQALKPQLPTDYLSALKALVASEEEKQKAIEERNKLIHDNKTYTTSEIAKELGMKSAQKLNLALSDYKIQYKQNGTWLPYSKYSDLGYTSVKQQILDDGKVIYDRRWTGKGRDFILSLFK